jgi:hypothetical protein
MPHQINPVADNADALFLQQPFLRIQTAGKSNKPAVASYHSMTGHFRRERIAMQRMSDRSRSGAQLLGQIAIRCHAPFRNPRGDRPDPLAERHPLENFAANHRRLNFRFRLSHVTSEFLTEFLGTIVLTSRIITLDLRRRIKKISGARQTACQ